MKGTYISKPDYSESFQHSILGRKHQNPKIEVFALAKPLGIATLIPGSLATAYTVFEKAERAQDRNISRLESKLAKAPSEINPDLLYARMSAIGLEDEYKATLENARSQIPHSVFTDNFNEITQNTARFVYTRSQDN